MKIGVPKEIKTHEYRVGMTPSCVKSYVSHGHSVMIQSNCGSEAGFSDEAYIAAGASVSSFAEQIYAENDMIVKVKEPISCEYDLLRDGQLLYTYLHLAADKALTRCLLDKNVRSVAYETIETDDGRLPCLKPMSEIAGRLSVQEGAKYLEKTFGGRGVLLGGVPGVPRAKVAIIGGGVVGTNAAKIAVGMGADVTVLDTNADRLAYLDDIFDMRISTLYSTESNIEQILTESDLVIGAVLLHGARAPKLVRRDQLKIMKPGAVLVDVAVDQGGCFETTRPTTHDEPVFVEEKIVHYCVANMPGAVALTSTNALTSTTLPYGLMIADLGLEAAVSKSAAIMRGLNTCGGQCTCLGVAEAFGLDYIAPMDIISEYAAR